ncbi:MAG: hypothetical protein BZ138_03880 [Methanosphaera sp. rholeuAM270]|nr:MAG: hypothetical protein BZ138_03880 [Methanosphaera sp. rholeuAM270]
MGLTSLFFEMENKNVLIIGTGSVGIRRSKRFLDSGANVSIITHGIDPEIKEELEQKGAEFFNDSDRDELLEKCDLVVIATDNLELNEEIAKKAGDKLVNCASNISLSNVIVPSTFKLGSVTVSLYTENKSPLMAKELRKKIQSVISPEDILNIELQENVRQILKESVDSQKERKEVMIKIKENPTVQGYLKDGDLESATAFVKKNFLNYPV